jgi:uncharacterized membrane protein
MSTSVIAILFNDPGEAARLKTEVQKMQTDGLLKVEDAVVVVRDQDGKASYDTSTPLPGAGTGAAWGSLWGVLIGSIFLMPVAGLAIGAAAGALSGKLSKIGIDASFKQALNDQLRPNTSALLLRVADVKQRDAVLERVKGFADTEQAKGQVLYTNLSTEAEQALETALKG